MGQSVWETEACEAPQKLNCWTRRLNKIHNVIVIYRFVNLKQHYVTLTTTRGFEKWNLLMLINTSNETAILVKLGGVSWSKCRLVFPLMSYDCSDSQRFLKATCRPPADWSCSCRQQVVVGDKRLQTVQSEDIRGKTRRHFLQKTRPSFTKTAVLCDILTSAV